MGGVGSKLKNRKNWWKFENLEKFTCIRYWSTNFIYFKNRSKSENFWHFGDFYSLLKPPMKLFLFFWYTVDPWEHVGAFSKKIHVKNFLIKINVSPLSITHRWSLFWSVVCIEGQIRIFCCLTLYDLPLRHWFSHRWRSLMSLVSEFNPSKHLKKYWRYTDPFLARIAGLPSDVDQKITVSFLKYLRS